MTSILPEAVYGDPPLVLATVSSAAVQVSPLAPGAPALEDMANGSLGRIIIAAPPGTLERRFVLAHALRALTVGGELIALAPKDKGGSRLGKELTGFGCHVVENARRHHRICTVRRGEEVVGLEAAIADGAPRLVPGVDLWSQPGVFSWDRIDPGTAMLLATPADHKGRGADLGCGIGVLARHVLRSAAVTDLLCVDIDSRAVDAARRNLGDPRARVVQADLRADPAMSAIQDLDFVIMNPPFHDAGREDRGLGLAFISIAARMLRKGGVCRVVANVALPYEARLAEVFKAIKLISQSGGYKVYEAVK